MGRTLLNRTQGFDPRGDVRQRIEEAHEFRDLLLAPVLGAGHHVAEVLARQVRPEQEQPGEVELAGSDGIEQPRKLADEPRRRDAAHRRVFGQSELVDAVREQTRASARAMQSARFDLAQMREQRCEHLIRSSDQPARVRQQLRIRELRNANPLSPRFFAVAHGDTLHLDFRGFLVTGGPQIARRNESKLIPLRVAFSRVTHERSRGFSKPAPSARARYCRKLSTQNGGMDRVHR